jgi:hypothetical protein
MKKLFSLPLFAAMLMTVAVSCNKNEFDSSYSHHIDFNSAGYYNYFDKYYEFVFTSDKLDLSSPVLSEPDGGWIEVSFPIECMGKKTPLSEKLNDFDDPFYIFDNRYSYYYGSDFKSGYIYADLDESKHKIKFEVDGITSGGYHLKVHYQGPISKSEEYIYSW